jgi:hypothetical protein
MAMGVFVSACDVPHWSRHGGKTARQLVGSILASHRPCG